jgi:hypothetical protein
MGFFNLIETFFFLSLGITFVLILLLVYHFKQRLTTLENKCDTVFEIISNVVKELNNIKHMQINSMGMNIPTNMIPFMDLNTFNEMSSQQINGKIKVSDDDFEESDDEDDEDDEDDDDDDEDDDDDDDEDDDEDDDDDDDEMPPLVDIDETQGNSGIKIINVDIGETIEIDALENEIDSDNNNDNNDNDDYEKLEPVELQEEEHIHVEKLNETNTLENIEVDKLQETSKEIYNKMSVSELKALVISKGLSSDPSKKKKNDLIKMLEASEI